MAENKRGNAGWKTVGGLGALLFAFGGKLKFLLPLLKFGKIGGTIWSMAVMIGAYAIIYPWTFSIGIVVMLLIHELGHVFAARKRGLPMSAPAFIPFLGAVVTMKKQPSGAETEAYIAYGGPLIGSLGAVAVLLTAMITGYEPLYAIAQIGFFLNLINLLPIHPLDGGRIVTAISRWLWVLGLIGGLIVILYLKAILFLLIWALFAWELYKAYVKKKPSASVATEELQLAVNRGIFHESGAMLPGEDHQRELSFVQYCKTEDQTQVVKVNYPGVGSLGEFVFEKGLVNRMELYKTSWNDEGGTMKIRLSYLPYPDYRTGAIRESAYYQVPRGTRIRYGAAYFGLALALGWLMYFTSNLMPLSAH